MHWTLSYDQITLPSHFNASRAPLIDYPRFLCASWVRGLLFSSPACQSPLVLCPFCHSLAEEHCEYSPLFKYQQPTGYLSTSNPQNRTNHFSPLQSSPSSLVQSVQFGPACITCFPLSAATCTLSVPYLYLLPLPKRYPILEPSKHIPLSCQIHVVARPLIHTSHSALFLLV